MTIPPGVATPANEVLTQLSSLLPGANGANAAHWLDAIRFESPLQTAEVGQMASFLENAASNYSLDMRLTDDLRRCCDEVAAQLRELVA